LHKATVLTVDDDANLQAVMRHYLESEGYRCLSAMSAAELGEKLESATPDIVLLDIVLPDSDGLTLLARIRSKCRAPVIFVSGKDATVDRVVGLEMGADDYITKPFEMRELSARIKAVLRRAGNNDGAPAGGDSAGATPLAKADRIVFNGWVLDRLQYQVFDPAGKSADLTSGEFRLLEALVTAPNRVLSRAHLFDLTRQGEFEAFDRAIDIQIGRIRKKIHDDPRQPGLIKTIRGVGYLFAGEARPEN
jgi:two-component system OmpR family response regulator